MNLTPKSERPHIALFGRRNSGKSSLINSITGQRLATVSEMAGTTTDPVYKAMELQPVGPVVFVDTAGLDDEGSLGKLRVEKTREVMRKADLALLVLDSSYGMVEEDKEILQQLEDFNIPVLIVLNKNDIVNSDPVPPSLDKVIKVSAKTGVGIEELKAAIADCLLQQKQEESTLIKDLIEAGDTVVLVTPIDSAAPKSRLILPQVQVLREVLDAQAIAMVTQVEQLTKTLESLKTPPALVVTDSQAFKEVANLVGKEIPLTSFSILMARYKGEISAYLEGVRRIEALQPGDKILIAEACTHQRQHEDIGTVKIPKLLQKQVQGELDFTWVRGGEFPLDLKEYMVIIHCGACMLTQRQNLSRISLCQQQKVPVVNYGMLLAFLNGILERSLKPLKVKEG